ncbi:MAG: hypothetical protein Q8M24_14975 [Pseudolabrys sp.]|nr:hypothetical protein [Pseudolabrys sp.]MDP2296748.1 hypothetical protein [Pseudolabrys sp.]
MPNIQRLFDRANGWRRRARADEDGGELDLSHHIRAAYVLLCDANKRAIQIPPDVVTILTQARRHIGAGELPAELEQRFWNAYGLLSSSIQPAEQARQSYKRIFYLTLAALLVGQLFYLGVESVRARLTDLDRESVKASAAISATTTANPATIPSGVAPAPVRSIQSLHAEQKAYLDLGRDLLSTADAVSFPLHAIGMKTIFAPPSKGTEADDLLVRGKIEMLAVFLAGYLLPMLYGLLGACAFVLRKLSDEIDKLTYANDMRVRYSLRLNIGLLSGLAVGWFIKPTASADSTLVTLSPVALAFIAGYGSELFFVFLDKIVQAFGGGNSATTSIREVTTGAITTTSFQHREAHVAGTAAEPEKKNPPDAHAEPPRNSMPAADGKSESHADRRVA